MLHASRVDHTSTRFAAVGYAAGVYGHDLVKIIPLRVRGLKTFGTIAPRQVRSGEGQIAVATPAPGGRLPHEYQLAMRASTQRMGPPREGLARSGAGSRALRTERGRHRGRPCALLDQHGVADLRGRVVALPHASGALGRGLQRRPFPVHAPDTLERSHKRDQRFAMGFLVFVCWGNGP